MINTLPDYQKQIIELRYKSKYSIQQVASHINRNEESLKHTIDNIVAKLEEKYKEIEKRS